jgi:starch-binding outer membrane protein, SusD/RagB family
MRKIMNHNKYIWQQQRLLTIMVLILVLLTQGSCKKYLEKKPVQNLAIPSSLGDLNSILNNQFANNRSVQFHEFVSDNYYLAATSLNNLSIDLRKNYTWDKDAKITIENSGAWNNPYQVIYQANFVLDFLPKIAISESERSIYNNIKGSALFFRAFMLYQLTQLYCKPYSSNTATTDLGIVIKSSPEVDEAIKRSTLQETYDQVIKDLEQASELLPVTNVYTTRPNKAAANGALARVYLSMRDYVNAGKYANNAIILNPALLDFNSLSPSGNPSLPENFLKNPEVLYVSYTTTTVFSVSHLAIPDSLLYQSYHANDLRKTVFYGYEGGKFYWKGCYYSTAEHASIFDGIATDELYLIRAESNARAGNTNSAMADLNILLRNRWKKGTFTDLTAANATDALNQILTERRKELAFRGLRWSDLRRLNLEGANITLKRVIENTEYSLPPNDLRWVLLIPELEINRSGIPQNPR